jgi:hypothetical protein
MSIDILKSFLLLARRGSLERRPAFPMWGLRHGRPRPDAYVNRQYQYARRGAPDAALPEIVGAAWLAMGLTCSNIDRPVQSG